MEIPPCVWIAILSVLWATDFINSLPMVTKIDCKKGTTIKLGEIDEGFTGDIEIIHSVSAVELKLDLSRCPSCAQCMEFISKSPMTGGTVKVKRPLDREALTETSALFYRIMCTSTGVVHNRELIVRDLNDNAPVFDKKEYRVNVAKNSPVGKEVALVRAVDADFSKANNRITYSIQPPSNTFEVNGYGGYGQIRLKEPLNDSSSEYKLTVKAQDPGGLFSETSVIISTTNQLRRFHCLETEKPYPVEGHREYEAFYSWDDQDLLWWCRYGVVISLNQRCKTVRAKLCEMKKALEMALGWSVTIISVSRCDEMLITEHPNYENFDSYAFPRPRQVSPPGTNVGFIARETYGYKLIPKETIQKKLRDDNNKVLERMRHVFGQHVKVDVIHVDADNRSDKTTTIILGSILAVVCTGVVVIAFFVKLRQKKAKHNECKWEQNVKNRRSKDHIIKFDNGASVEEGPNIGEESNASINDRPNIGGRTSINDRPNLGDQASVDNGPNLGDRASIEDGPNLGDRASTEDGPNLRESVSLQSRQGIY